MNEDKNTLPSAKKLKTGTRQTWKEIVTHQSATWVMVEQQLSNTPDWVAQMLWMLLQHPQIQEVFWEWIKGLKEVLWWSALEEFLAKKIKENTEMNDMKIFLDAMNWNPTKTNLWVIENLIWWLPLEEGSNGRYEKVITILDNPITVWFCKESLHPINGWELVPWNPKWFPDDLVVSVYKRWDNMILVEDEWYQQRLVWVWNRNESGNISALTTFDPLSLSQEEVFNLLSKVLDNPNPLLVVPPIQKENH